MSDDELVEVAREDVFGIVWAGVIRDPVLSVQAKALYALLTTYANAGRQCWPTRRTLSEQLGCSRDTVDRAVKPLIASGVVDLIPRFKDGVAIASLYRLHDVRGGRKSAATPEGEVAANLRPRLSHQRDRGGRTSASQNRTNEQHHEQDHSRGSAVADAATLPIEGAAAEPTVAQVAQRITGSWWESFTPRPVTPYPGQRKIVARLLEAGWAVADVERALRASQPPLTVHGMERALRGSRTGPIPVSDFSGDEWAPGIKYDGVTTNG